MPSRNGWAVLVAALVAIVCGRLFGVVELYMLGSGVVALVVLAVARTSLRRCGVTVVRVAEPSRPRSATTPVCNSRSGAETPTPAIDLWEPVEGVGGAASLRLAPLRRGRTHVGDISPAHHPTWARAGRTALG